MLVIVTYDVNVASLNGQKRLRKVAKLCALTTTSYGSEEVVMPVLLVNIGTFVSGSCHLLRCGAVLQKMCIRDSNTSTEIRNTNFHTILIFQNKQGCLLAIHCRTEVRRFQSRSCLLYTSRCV